MAFKSLSDIEKYCADNNVRYGRAVMLEDMRESGRSGDETLKRMEETWSAMEEALDDYDRLRRSQSGLSGGKGSRLKTSSIAPLTLPLSSAASRSSSTT